MSKCYDGFKEQLISLVKEVFVEVYHNEEEEEEEEKKKEEEKEEEKEE